MSIFCMFYKYRICRVHIFFTHVALWICLLLDELDNLQFYTLATGLNFDCLNLEYEGRFGWNGWW